MTYYINVKKTHRREFSQIIQSLKDIGVVESIVDSGSLVRDGEPLHDAELLYVLKHSENEIAEGKSRSMKEVAEFIKNLKND